MRPTTTCWAAHPDTMGITCQRRRHHSGPHSCMSPTIGGRALSWPNLTQPRSTT
jgi:hypothetical protein